MNDDVWVSAELVHEWWGCDGRRWAFIMVHGTPLLANEDDA